MACRFVAAGTNCGALGFHNLETIGDWRGLAEHRRHRAVFLLAQLNRVPHRSFIERAPQLVDNFELGPNPRRLLGSLPRYLHLQGLKFLPLFRKD